MQVVLACMRGVSPKEKTDTSGTDETAATS